MNTNFENWMRRVDRLLESIYGMTSEDMTDFTWRSCFDDGLSPSDAVACFVEDGDFV